MRRSRSARRGEAGSPRRDACAPTCGSPSSCRVRAARARADLHGRAVLRRRDPRAGARGAGRAGRRARPRRDRRPGGVALRDRRAGRGGGRAGRRSTGTGVPGRTERTPARRVAPGPAAPLAALPARQRAEVLRQRRPARADAVILDLEDSVHPDDKDAARLLVRNALRRRLRGAERMVRINQLPLGSRISTPIVPEGRI